MLDWTSLKYQLGYKLFWKWTDVVELDRTFNRIVSNG